MGDDLNRRNFIKKMSSVLGFVSCFGLTESFCKSDNDIEAGKNEELCQCDTTCFIICSDYCNSQGCSCTAGCTDGCYNPCFRVLCPTDCFCTGGGSKLMKIKADSGQDSLNTTYTFRFDLANVNMLSYESSSSIENNAEGVLHNAGVDAAATAQMNYLLSYLLDRGMQNTIKV